MHTIWGKSAQGQSPHVLRGRRFAAFLTKFSSDNQIIVGINRAHCQLISSLLPECILHYTPLIETLSCLASLGLADFSPVQRKRESKQEIEIVILSYWLQSMSCGDVRLPAFLNPGLM